MSKQGDFTNECKKIPKKLNLESCSEHIQCHLPEVLWFLCNMQLVHSTFNPHMNSIAFTLYIWEVICWYNPDDYVLPEERPRNEDNTVSPSMFNNFIINILVDDLIS